MSKATHIPPKAKSLAREGDYERYLCALFARKEVQGELFAIIALNGELARIPRIVTDPMAGEIRLVWWRDAVEKAARGEILKHPLLEVLAPIVQGKEGPDVKGLHTLIEARHGDLYPETFDTFEALKKSRQKFLAPLIRLFRETLAGKKTSDAAFREAFLVYDLVGLLRNLPFDLQRGACCLPHAILNEHKLNEVSALRPENLPALKKAVAAFAGQVEDMSDDMRKKAPARPEDLLPVFLQASLADWHLKKLKAADFDPFRFASAGKNPVRFFHVYLKGIRGRF